MNFLSKTFSSFTGTSIPYTIKDKVIDPSSPTAGEIDSRSIWTVYNGANPKTDNSPVTIFEFVLKDPTNVQRGYDLLARNAFKKAKLIKFPGIISVIDFVESETHLYIITEPVVPLLQYLRTSGTEGNVSRDTKFFGIYNLAHTLSFINMKGNCLHGNINLFNSVYVNQSGDWKLFGFEVLTNLTSDPDQPIYRFSRALPGFDQTLPADIDPAQGLDGVRQFPIKFDSYKFGLFIYNVLTTTDFTNVRHDNNTVDQAKLNKVPNALAAHVKKLINPRSNLRITVEKFAQDTESYFGKNTVIQFSKQLEEIKFKNETEKLEFFKYELSSYLSDENGNELGDVYPPGLLDYKLLPELVLQFNALSKLKPTVNTSPLELQQRQETISAILNYILKFGVKLNQEQFNKTVKPIVLETFALADRSIRLILLTHLPSFEKFLTESDIQSKIFYNLISGFQDTNFMIRETTLKSITIIIDKVSVKQVNQDLLKVLAKSQMDPKPSIRVNTLVLIIKISSKIYKTSKNSVLITALAKSLRDTFTPCKMMALSGFESLIDDFTLEEICSKILGHLAISLMDNKSAKIRERAKSIFQLYLASVEKHASTLPREEEDADAEEVAFYQKFAPSSASSESVESEAKASGGALSSFGWSMVNKLTASSVEGQLNNEFNSSTPDLTRVGTPTSTPLVHQNPAPKAVATEVDQSWVDDIIDDNDDGWGMDDAIENEEPPISKLSLDEKKPIRAVPKAGTSKPATTRKTSSLKLGKATKKPGSTLKLNLTVDENDDSWGDQW